MPRERSPEKSPDLADRLRELRSRHKASLGQVARAIGASAAHLSAIESRKIGNPGYKTVVALADFYGVPITELLGTSPLTTPSLTFEEASEWLKWEAGPRGRAALIALARFLKDDRAE